MRNRFLLLLSATAIFAGAIPAFADDEIETVVVTATRTEQPLARTGESESVLTGDTLQTLQTVSLTDALALTPGIVVDQAGGIGQPTTISIRGAETGQTLVLIDGVRINDPSTTDSGAIFGDVLANNIDRVEILRGPQSALYGSDAIGGVVNIISKRGGNSPFAFTASAEGGSFDTYHLNAAADGTLDTVDYGIAANYIHSNGISAADSRGFDPDTGRDNSETDGYGNLGLTGNARWHIADNISLDLRGYYIDARADFDDDSGFLPPYPTYDSGAYNKNRFLEGYAGVNADFFDGMFHNRLAVMATESDRSFYNSYYDFGVPTEDADDKGHSTRIEYQGTLDISPDDQAVFGAESEHTSFKGVSTYGNDRGSATINSVYGQYQKTLFGRLTLTGGIRYDDHSQFGSHTSVKLAGAYDFGEGTVLHANYATGFKAPSLYELYSTYYGNRDLKPETAHGWEAGIDHAFLDGKLRGGVTYFERRTANLIDYAGFAYFNVAKTQARGVEAKATASITDTFTLSANYTYLDAKDLTTGLNLQRRPHDTFSVIANWNPEVNWGLGASLNSVSNEVDQYAYEKPCGSPLAVPSPTPVACENGGHTTVNAFGHYDIGQWSVYARVDNLFGAHYEPLIGYGAPGRAVYAGFRLSE
jgi:vitamin B12 transporter